MSLQCYGALLVWLGVCVVTRLLYRKVVAQHVRAAAEHGLLTYERDAFAMYVNVTAGVFVYGTVLAAILFLGGIES